MLLLLLVFGAGYWRGVSHAPNGKRVGVQRDNDDDQGVTTAKPEYEPYFAKQNLIPSTPVAPMQSVTTQDLERRVGQYELLK